MKLVSSLKQFAITVKNEFLVTQYTNEYLKVEQLSKTQHEEETKLVKELKVAK